MKKLLALLSLVALVIGGWYLASPWLALKGLRDAAEARDAAELEQRVDFSAMRASLREELGEAMRDRATSGSPLDAIAARAVEEFAGGALDQVVTPRGIASVITTGAIASPLIPETLRGQKLEWDVERSGFDSFRAFGTFDGGAPGPVLVFAREGLGWRMVGLELR